jgi:2-(1,2-epoxy-1,2-dihydrophenyl)acetyl-CoA isomerase
MSDPEAPVLARTQGAVLTLTLNRPKSLNSFDGAMHDALMGQLKAAAANVAVRCVVLTGTGRAFCAGQDLADPSIAPDPTPGAPPRDVGAVVEARYKPLVMMLHHFPVPVIAAVNGVAAGAGANVALACDMVLAARSASFIQAFSKIGLIPDAGGTWLLPRLVGHARAMGLAFTGERLPAEEAQRIGLIWRCVEDAELPAQVQALAERLAALPVHALAETRRTFARSDHLTLSEALSLEAEVQRKLGYAHDAAEGIAAFLEKRPPHFTDR